MDKFTAFLLDWTRAYVENQDIIRKSIKGIKQKGSRLEVEYSEKRHTYLIDPFLENIDDEMGEAGKEEKFSIVCFNNPENLKKMVMKWQDLIRHPLLSVFFVNPFSNLDKRWIVYPSTHHRIADENSLELGLKTIAEGVEPLTREEAERKI